MLSRCGDAILARIIASSDWEAATIQNKAAPSSSVAEKNTLSVSQDKQASDAEESLRILSMRNEQLVYEKADLAGELSAALTVQEQARLLIQSMQHDISKLERANSVREQKIITLNKKFVDGCFVMCFIRLIAEHVRKFIRKIKRFTKKSIVKASVRESK